MSSWQTPDTVRSGVERSTRWWRIPDDFGVCEADFAVFSCVALWMGWGPPLRCVLSSLWVQSLVEMELFHPARQPRRQPLQVLWRMGSAN